MAGITQLDELNMCTKIINHYTLLTLLVINCVLSVNPGDEGQVLPIADSNWTLILQGEWMLKFYAPWCPACQQIQPDWENFAKHSKGLGITVGKVDVTQQPGLSGRFLVTTLPTIFHAKDGSFRRYLSSRAVEDLQSYIIEKKWESVEPVPGWKSPSSIAMRGMASLFQLSVWIRQIHSYLTETLGIPVWGSYAIFALATLLTGLLLGLMLVLLADCLCPSKPKNKDVKRDEYIKDDVSEEEEDFPSEEKHLSDGENEISNLSDKVSGDESAGEEGSVPDDIGADTTDGQLSEKVTDSTVRKRKPQTLETQEET
ncbi:thioredoxin-related transmembrane protein 4 isoform X2 [Amia ocellicauda]|uniref:thioredoxin-related transmembrane protein 4 isoform X2 n=1 Tax=Amia ocellicauda TaxID=2972642 RepID=UPI003464424D